MARRATGVPAALLRRRIAVFRTADAAEVYAAPRPQLRRLVAAGLVHRLADGFYVPVPAGSAGLRWTPGLEAAAGGIAAAAFGADQVAIMGLSAARVHGAVPRALAVASVAVPRQRRLLRFADRDAHLVFVRRDVDRLQVELTGTEVGDLLVTGREQTALDLAHRVDLGDAPDQAREAAVVLFRRSDHDRIQAMAREQRLGASLTRLQAWADA
jgi:hypothetical protein